MVAGQSGKSMQAGSLQDAIYTHFVLAKILRALLKGHPNAHDGSKPRRLSCRKQARRVTRDSSSIAPGWHACGVRKTHCSNGRRASDASWRAEATLTTPGKNNAGKSRRCVRVVACQRAQGGSWWYSATQVLISALSVVVG
jgi:hypothetical protein